MNGGTEMDVREKQSSEKRLIDYYYLAEKIECPGEPLVYWHDIEAAPTVDAVEVVHGRWKEMHYEGGILDRTNFDRCSVCGYERVFDDPALKTVFKYCPNCGAIMDGGAE